MKHSWFHSTAILAAVAIGFAGNAFAGEGCGSSSASAEHSTVLAKSEKAGAAKKEEKARKDIVDTAVGAGSFSTLVAAVKAAGLVDTLKGEGPFTVFAPSDEAFAKLPKGTLEDLLKPENKEKLTKILTYHVVAGKILAKDAQNAKSAKTVNGEELRISVKDGSVYVDNAKVVKADIETSNGVIHVIDAVVLPKQ
jgi:transforming growth factor-beta-induced protein